MKIFSILGLLSVTLSSQVFAHDFDTTATVRFVVECMSDMGMQSDENLYTCSCRLDALGEKITFTEYQDALIFRSYKLMPGEKGALFRHNEQGEELIAKLEEAEAAADAQCINVTRVERPKSHRVK